MYKPPLHIYLCGHYIYTYNDVSSAQVAKGVTPFFSISGLLVIKIKKKTTSFDKVVIKIVQFFTILYKMYYYKLSYLRLNDF